jgi:hypothetical protein
MQVYAKDGDDVGVREFSVPDWKIGDTVVLRECLKRSQRPRGEQLASVGEEAETWSHAVPATCHHRPPCL